MGAYYMATNLDAGLKVGPHQFNNGFKLMEHSWLKNNYVAYIMEALAGGKEATGNFVGVPNWKGCRLSWLCDYHNDDTMNWDIYIDYKVPDLSVPSYLNQHSGIKVYRPIDLSKSFIVNDFKREYISIERYEEVVPKDGGWIVHPLPLLTASNDSYMGGGDFDGSIGSEHKAHWCKDSIRVELKRRDVPEDYKDCSEVYLFKEDF